MPSQSFKSSPNRPLKTIIDDANKAGSYIRTVKEYLFVDSFKPNLKCNEMMKVFEAYHSGVTAIDVAKDIQHDRVAFSVWNAFGESLKDSLRG